MLKLTRLRIYPFLIGANILFFCCYSYSYLSHKAQGDAPHTSHLSAVAGQHFPATTLLNHGQVATVPRATPPARPRPQSKTTPPELGVVASQDPKSDYKTLTRIILDTTGGCGNATSYDAIVTVHTAPAHIQHRNMFRKIYGDFRNTKPYRLKVVFLLGLVSNQAEDERLKAEAARHHDIVQGNFLDHYHNLTYKAIMGFQWLDERCKGLKLLLRLDDDTFVHVQKLIELWESKHSGESSTIMCEAVYNDPVRRAGRWRVSQAEINATRYRFHHCLGYFAALSPGLIPRMHAAAKQLQFFWIDDVFMYGMVPKLLGDVKFDRKSNPWTRNAGLFEDCLEVKGDKCPHLVTIANFRKFETFLRYIKEKVG
ncbi:beta-1,3-galactosyltransferase 5 [Aplysia californica]|uniref:Hexosyltransferase n=1 Tax=Aplysia californica TaxID=6500 RepID=A0ABM1VX55_APLCA|nr:beta-1,3-galactosyltransferase 5 [Aplysia californica]